MRTHFLLNSQSVNQALEENPATGGLGRSGGIARRTFLKRTGGATVAALVGWNLQVTTSRAEEETEAPGSGSKVWAMRCSSPTDIQVNLANFTTLNEKIEIGTTNQLDFSSIILSITTTKFSDELGSPPFNSCAYSVIVSLDVEGFLGVDNPLPFSGTAGYWEDLLVTCDPWNGKVDWGSAGRSNVPVTASENISRAYVEVNGIYTLVLTIYSPVTEEIRLDDKTVFLKTSAYATIDLYDMMAHEFPVDPYELEEDPEDNETAYQVDHIERIVIPIDDPLIEFTHQFLSFRLQ